MKPPRSLLVLFAWLALSATANPNGFADAARELDRAIAEDYAYLDKLPGGELPRSAPLDAQREAVRDARSLLAYAERRIASLADHHAITGSAFAHSWALVPSYADLWIVVEQRHLVIDAVRAESPAAAAGIRSGDRIESIGGVPAADAIKAFWAELGLEVTPERAGYAARVLVAGRRERPRRLTVATPSGELRELMLPSLYSIARDKRPPISLCSAGGQTTIRFNDSLSDPATIAAFDDAMRLVAKEDRLILDLRDTPSGGNTTIARAIMGWFVTAPHFYQTHNRPAELRETGIPRQWTEQVLPRAGRYRAHLPRVLVGRWTGSMGEGLAIGFHSMGADVQGTKMARLAGSVEDIRLGETDLFVKLPTERLLTVAGLPREDFVPQPMDEARFPSAPCR
jgi:carboxyl-terminal processing protease